ncbi:MAG: NAD(P)H-hydrate dehydratase [Candidatus Margulisiibacteriota bacterium]
MLNKYCKPITSKEMKALDRWAIEELGIPQPVLMENAGKKVFDAVKDNIGSPERVCVVCGKGNNGGDARIAARYLKNSGMEVRMFEAEKDNISALPQMLKGCRLVIDGLFGIGLDRNPEGVYAEVITLINSGKRTEGFKVVAVDIPSGLDADSGNPRGLCVEADLTVTFHLPKVGMVKDFAPSKIGKLVVADIGIPYDNFQCQISNSRSKNGPNVIDVEYVKRCLPERRFDCNKGDNGRVMIFAGSKGMSGAAMLAGMAALRSGAGLVYLSVPAEIQNYINVSVPEIITLADVAPKKAASYKLKAAGVGPGIGKGKKRLLKDLIKTDLNCPLIIDADGLNSIADDTAVLLKKKNPIILTPHPGEMARLLGITVEKVQQDRSGTAIRTAKDLDAVVVLKGANTVIADPSGKHLVNRTGNPGLATAGTGDVLTGMICSFAAQGMEAFFAAACAVFVHGLCADTVAVNKGYRGIIASDIIDALPFVINSLTGTA